MSWIETYNMTVLQKYLDLASQRHTLIASNMANIDTPGYRTQDIRFSNEFNNFLNGTATEDSHSQPYEVQGLIERPDGNNVSVDRESMLEAQTQLQYRVGIELLKTEFHTLLSAINEGR